MAPLGLLLSKVRESHDGSAGETRRRDAAFSDADAGGLRRHEIRVTLPTKAAAIFRGEAHIVSHADAPGELHEAVRALERSLVGVLLSELEQRFDPLVGDLLFEPLLATHHARQSRRSAISVRPATKVFTAMGLP